jgi:signal transduction histidine kinase
MSHRALELLGGEIVVRNIPGKGCVFAISLPRVTRTETAPSPPAQ